MRTVACKNQPGKARKKEMTYYLRHSAQQNKKYTPTSFFFRYLELKGQRREKKAREREQGGKGLAGS